MNQQQARVNEIEVRLERGPIQDVAARNAAGWGSQRIKQRGVKVDGVDLAVAANPLSQPPCHRPSARADIEAAPSLAHPGALQTVDRDRIVEPIDQRKASPLG
jgi:hypothetical protein